MERWKVANADAEPRCDSLARPHSQGEMFYLSCFHPELADA
jgi:hypothetical protein